MALPEEARAMGAPPSWCSYVGTPDVDDTVRSAVSLGAKVLKPAWDIPTVGRLAVLEDPQQAVFALFAPTEVQSGPAPDPAAFSWHELVTTDWRSALTFYQRLFGWETTSAMEMGPELGTYQMFGQNGKPMGGMYSRPAHVPRSHWLPYIRVADSKKTGDLVKKLHGQVLVGPMEVPGGDWIVVGSDLQGATFAVHSAKPADVKKPAATKKRAAAKKPAAKPAAKKAAAKKAAVKKAAVKKPAARKSAAKKPVVKKPGAKRSKRSPKNAAKDAATSVTKTLSKKAAKKAAKAAKKAARKAAKKAAKTAKKAAKAARRAARKMRR
jgi:hypothetical protein